MEKEQEQKSEENLSYQKENDQNVEVENEKSKDIDSENEKEILTPEEISLSFFARTSSFKLPQITIKFASINLVISANFEIG